jgi:hypothetical protein
MSRNRWIQLGAILLAAAALAASATLRGPIERVRRERSLVITPVGTEEAKDPRIALLEAVPGGLRAPFLTHLWIRSQELKDEGRFYDAVGLRELICDLMPHFSGVWAFHGWDMAWNISVATHTPEERWMWVHNGLKLLRDKGLRYNPEDLVLYKELSWLFFQKMGGDTDEMHRVYKLQWLRRMEYVLGMPPTAVPTVAGPEETPAGSDPATEAFRPIAEAPDDFAALPEPARKLGLELADLGAAPGPEFLRAYNRFRDDPLLPWPTEQPEGEDQTRVAGLMADPELAEPRDQLLAFSRRQVLADAYRMDADWMLRLMEHYGPLDWRHTMSHSIYWASLGLKKSLDLDLEDLQPTVAEAKLKALAEAEPAAQERILREQGMKLSDIQALNTQRNIINGLKTLATSGRIYYDPTRRQDPRGLVFAPDLRFIKPTHELYVAGGERLLADPGPAMGDKNALKGGHINFLANSIIQLYAAGRVADAREYFDYIRDGELFEVRGPEYERDVEHFVFSRLERDPKLPSWMFNAIRYGALRRAYLALAAGQNEEYVEQRGFAIRLYNRFREGSGKFWRLRPPPFEQEEMFFLRDLMIDARAAGLRLSVFDKSRLYKSLPLRMRQALYPALHPLWQREAAREGINFEAAFPAPPPPQGQGQPPS